LADCHSDQATISAQPNALIRRSRKDIATFDNEQYLTRLPNEEICVANTWSGDYAVAKARAKDAGIDLNLVYAVPKTGAPLWFDVMGIPKDAPNKANAHAFLSFLMQPEVIAACSNFIGYANANKRQMPLWIPQFWPIPPSIRMRKPSVGFGHRKP
jgi:putrescine transport system substrate-binding protein